MCRIPSLAIMSVLKRIPAFGLDLMSLLLRNVFDQSQTQGLLVLNAALTQTPFGLILPNHLLVLSKTFLYLYLTWFMVCGGAA